MILTAAIEPDAAVRQDQERGAGYMAMSTAGYIGAVMLTDWVWTGYGDTPEEAIGALEGQLRNLHKKACKPRRIVLSWPQSTSASRTGVDEHALKRHAAHQPPGC